MAVRKTRGVNGVWPKVSSRVRAQRCPGWCCLAARLSPHGFQDENEIDGLAGPEFVIEVTDSTYEKQQTDRKLAVSGPVRPGSEVAWG